jgi:hypothetical protein
MAKPTHLAVVGVTVSGGELILVISDLEQVQAERLDLGQHAV